MNPESLKVSADVCEEHGNSQTAKLLRNLSDDKATAYMVVEKQSDYDDEVFYLSGESPQKLFLERKEAVAYAKLQNARRYKKVNPCQYGHQLSEISDFGLMELELRIQDILDPSYTLPNEEDMWHDHAPIFPDDATDEQMLKIAKLFKIQFFEVIKTKISL